MTTQQKISLSLRNARRKQTIANHLGLPHMNAGPLGATLAFHTDGDVLDEGEFQSKVFSSIDKVEKSITKVRAEMDALKDPANTVPEIKSALEELTKLKRVANDQQANADKFVAQIKKLEALVQLEHRSSFKDPIARISADPEMRVRFNIAVRQAMERQPGEFVKRDGRLVAQFKDITGKALGEDTSPGSTLIDDRLASEIYDTLATFGVWNTFRVVPVSNQTVKFPVTTARPTANFVLTEAGTVSDGSVTGTSVSCVIEVIAALINVSLQLLEDSEFDVTSYVMDMFAEAYANRLDVACLTADGTADATNGGMTGIFVGGTAANAAAGNSTTELLDFEDFLRCLTTVDPIVLNRASKWWTHPQHLVRALAVKDANGRPIFLTAMEAPAPGALGTILGYPVIPSFAAPTTNAAATKAFVFGDPGCMVVGMRRQYGFEASDHHRWNTLERSFRGWGRAGTKIRRATAFAMLTLTA